MFVSLDCESDLIQAGRLDPDLVCAQFCDESYLPELCDHMRAEQAVSDLLACEDVNIVGANIAFDFGVILREYPRLRNAIFAAYSAGRILDIQLAQRLIDIGHGELDGTYNHNGLYVKYSYSLAALFERWGLGVLQKEGTWRLRYRELRGVRVEDYPQEALDYALDDASATLKVWAMQSSAYPHMLKDLAAQTRAAFALHLMSIRGAVTDARACDEYLEATKLEIEGYKKLLLEHGLLRPDTPKKAGSRDTKAAQDYMARAVELAGLENPKMTDGGKFSLDAEACRDVGDPVMKAYSAFVSAKSTLTRVEKLKLGSGDVPLQTSFVSLVNNGRTASREPKADDRDKLTGVRTPVGLNLQNMPRGGMSRQVFVPRRRFKLNSVDFPGAELHTFAQVEKWLTGKSLIGDALNEGKDLHCVLAAAFLGCSYEEVLENKKVGKYKRARQLCKNVNFGMLAYMGAKRLMQTINVGAKTRADRIDLDTAERLRWLWLDTWQTQPYFDVITNTLDTSGGLATVEQFVSGRVRGKLSFTELANTYFSGLAADAFKAALWALTVECYTDESSVLYGSRPLLPVHDEIIVEIQDNENLSAAAWRQAEIMSEVFSQYTPDYPIHAKPALMNVWLKSAEDVYDESGNLRCFNPRIDDKDFKEEEYLKRALELCAA